MRIASAGRRAGLPGPLALEVADRFDRQQALLLLGLGGAWMVYTYLYFWLHPRGLTVLGV